LLTAHSVVLQLLDVSIVRDQKTGQSQGFAFLTVSYVCFSLALSEYFSFTSLHNVMYSFY